MRIAIITALTVVCWASAWPLFAAASDVLVSLNLDMPMATVPAAYLSTTTDIATFVDHDHCNFENETLRQMARALGCSHMRLGGTEMDFTFYNNFPGSLLNITNPSELPSGFNRIFTWEQWRQMLGFAADVGWTMYVGLNAGWGGDGLVRAPLSSGGDWLPTMASWLMDDAVRGGFVDTIEAFEFSNEPNLYPFGGNIANDTLAWALNGTRLAHDLRAVRAAMSLTQGHHHQGSQTQEEGCCGDDGRSASAIQGGWKLVCCDVAYVPLFGEIDPFVAEFAAAGGVAQVDETTFHFYPLLGASYNKSLPPDLDPFYAAVDKVLDPWILDQVGYWADRFVSDSGISGNVTMSPGVVLGETGSAVGGGQNGLSNRFADVIEYIDKIGQMTRRGQRKMFRQTFCGSPDQYYALISHNLTLHPSYFVTALLNFYVFGEAVPRSSGAAGAGASAGTVHVWNATVAVSDGTSSWTRVYAFSARSDVGPFAPPNNSSGTPYVVIGVLNLKNTTDTVTLQLGADQTRAGSTSSYAFSVNRSCAAYRLDVTSGEGDAEGIDGMLGARTIRFNGAVMGWDASSASISPPLGSILDPVDTNSVISSPVAATITSVALGWSFWWLPVVQR